MSWTEERVETLRKLWSDGLTASQIAVALGGVTRNAVIGKVHRLGLSGRVKSAGASSAPPPPRYSHPPSPLPQRSMPVVFGNLALKVTPEASPCPVFLQPVPKPEPEPEPDIAARATILTLTQASCRWPIGEPGSDAFYFCGRQSTGSMPYCPAHARLAYQPMALRRRDRR